MKIQEFDYSVNLLQSVLWQYNEATNLLGLVTSKQNWYDINQTQFWQNWYNNVFNLLTANGFGIVVWSIILNLPLYVNFEPEPTSAPIWGFNAYTPTLENTYENFTRGNFSPIGSVIELTLEEQRFLLRLRYFQLSNLTDIIDINTFLNYLCATSDIEYTGTIYVQENFGMSITYVFTTDDFDPDLLEVIDEFYLLPKPAGVAISYLTL